MPFELAAILDFVSVCLAIFIFKTAELILLQFHMPKEQYCGSLNCGDYLGHMTWWPYWIFPNYLKIFISRTTKLNKLKFYMHIAYYFGYLTCKAHLDHSTWWPYWKNTTIYIWKYLSSKSFNRSWKKER